METRENFRKGRGQEPGNFPSDVHAENENHVRLPRGGNVVLEGRYAGLMGKMNAGNTAHKAHEMNEIKNGPKSILFEPRQSFPFFNVF